MTKHFRIRRWIILYHDIDIGQVEATCSNVGAEEDGGLKRGREMVGKACQGRCTDRGREVTMQGGEMNVRKFGQPAKDLSKANVSLPDTCPRIGTYSVKVIHGGAGGKVDDELCRAGGGFLSHSAHEL